MASTPFALIASYCCHVAGQVRLVAGRRERAGHAEQDDFLPAENVVRGHRRGAVFRNLRERPLGQPISNANGHSCAPLLVKHQSGAVHRTATSHSTGIKRHTD